MDSIELIKLLKRQELFTKEEGYWNSKDPGFVELWDFSVANLSHENRVRAVSKVASVCYGNEGLKPNFNLYSKLERESIGLPSSSFEFVPVLLKFDQLEFLDSISESIKTTIISGIDPMNSLEIKITLDKDLEKLYKSLNTDPVLNVKRFGYQIGFNYLITNLRALMYDLEIFKNIIQKLNMNINKKDLKRLDPNNDFWYNTKEDIEIIKNNFFVFRKKITIRDARQDERHRRAMWQELSRRYTSDSKVNFEFRLTEKMKNSKHLQFLKDSIYLYQEAIKDGVPAQEARDLIPVSVYTVIWNAWYPDGLQNYFALRTKSSAQKEIRTLAQTMKELINNLEVSYKA